MNAFRRRAAASALALAVVTGTAALTAPAVFAAETPAPPAPTENIPTEEPMLVTASTHYTQEESALGISWVATNMPQGEATVSITTPSGETFDVPAEDGTPYTVNADGIVQGTAARYDANGAEQALDIGEYTLAVTVGDVTVTADFVVEGDESTPTETATPTATPTATATETTTPEPTETAAAPTLVIEKELYTVAETVDGIGWAATGMVPGEAYTVELVYPDGTVAMVPPVEGNDQIAEADGTAAGNIQYTVDGVPSPLEMEGTYVVRVTQGALVLEASTAVGAPSEMPSPTATATSTETPTAGSGDTSDGSGLAETGATAETAGIALGAGLALVVAGAGLLVVRRRTA